MLQRTASVARLVQAGQVTIMMCDVKAAKDPNNQDDKSSIPETLTRETHASGETRPTQDVGRHGNV